MKTTAEELRERGRDYLMQVRPNDLTASATLKALGYGENGLSDEAVSLHPSEGEIDHSNLMSYIKKRWEQIEATVKRHGSDRFQIYRTGVEDGAAFGNSTPTDQPKQEPSDSDVDFRKDIANELTRGELIDRLCELQVAYTDLREKYLFPTEPKEIAAVRGEVRDE